MDDQRRYTRDDTVNPGISCLLELPSGDSVDGVVIDISDTGARVSGVTDGLQIGSEYRITLVVQSYQKVAYHCIVRHIDAAASFYGIEFITRPEIVKPVADEPVQAHSGRSEKDVRRCPVDGRVFPVDYRYCPFDKSNLVLENY